VVPNAANARIVRVPLVKTAAGDLDYEVVIKYGGSLPPLGRTASVEFPLIRAVNINAELSQVRLLMPETYKWFDFDSTMRLVTDEADLAAGFISYQTKRAQRLIQTMRSAGDFSQVRAASSLKRLRQEMDEFQKGATKYRDNAELQKEWASNLQVIEGAEQQRQEVESQLEGEAIVDNRENLNLYFANQQAARALDAVKEVGGNFVYAAQAAATTQPAGAAGQFDKAWFEGNNLSGVPESRGAEAVGQRIAVQSQEQQSNIELGVALQRRGMSEPQATNVAQFQLEKLADNMPREWNIIVSAPNEARKSGRQPAKQQILKDYAQQLEQRANMPVQTEKFGREAAGRLSFGEVAFADDFSASAGVDRVGATTGGMGGGMPAGLVSLDVAIPEHGVVYRFTTPRGKVEITARAISHSFLETLWHLAAAVVVILVVWQAGRLVRWEGWSRWQGRRGAKALLGIGVISVLTGVFAIAGLVAIVAGLIMYVRSPKPQSPTTQPAN